jgi:hypothetical protein
MLLLRARESDEESHDINPFKICICEEVNEIH